MIFQAFLVLLQGVTFLAFAATILTPADQNAGSNSLQLLPDMADPASNLVAAKPGPHTSLLNTSLTYDEPQCLDGMGTNINLASCRNVVGKIPRSFNYISLGWRGTGHFDLTLPYIYVSDDGACVVYVAPKPTLQPDIFTLTGISENAQQIVQKCVVDPSIGSGGIVTGLGRSGELSVQIAKPDLHVECDDSPAPSYSSCRNVLDIMPWDQTNRRFGPGGQYQLPFLIPSYDGQCVFQLTADGAASMPCTARWVGIHLVIALIDEVCVKNRRSGHGYTAGGTAQGLKVSIAQRREVNVS